MGPMNVLNVDIGGIALLSHRLIADVLPGHNKIQ